MKQDVKKYCEESMVSQRNKTLALSRTGLLMPFEVLKEFGKIFRWISWKGYQRQMDMKSYLLW